MYVICITALPGVIGIDNKLLAILMLLAFAVVSDLRTYRIRNTLTFGFMLIGLVLNLASDGARGLLFSLQGLLLPVLCLLLFYMMRAIGAGDIKLLSAIGALMGPAFVLDTMLFTCLCGGLMAALLIITRRNGATRMRQLLLYAWGCILTMSLLEYSDMQDRSDGSKFHFSIAIAAGTLIAMIIDKLGATLF